MTDGVTLADVFNSTWSSEVWQFEGTDTMQVGASLPKLRSIATTQNMMLPSAVIYSIGLDLATDYTFPSALIGYGEQMELNIVVSNTGRRATEELNITLSGAGESNFALDKSSISNIYLGSIDSFSIKPNTGLSNGTYTETVTVSGNNGILKTFNVSFTVTKPADPTPTPEPTPVVIPEPIPTIEPTVDMIKLAPSSATVIQGKTKSFTATVVGTEDSSKEVSWSVEGNTSSNTVISTDGVLTVGNDEGATSLIVKATSKEDNTKSAQVKVKVVAKKGTKFTVGNYTYIIADDKFNGTGTVTLTGVAKGKTVTTVNVSETVKYKGVEYDVTAIGEKAFYQNKDIKKATIGNNVTVIGKNSFRECTSLTEVIVGDSVTVISYGAFYKCTTLKKITIGTGLQEIGNHAFCHDKALETMIIESTKLTKLGDHVLYANMKLTIKVPSSKVNAYEKLFTKTVQGKKTTVVKN